MTHRARQTRLSTIINVINHPNVNTFYLETPNDTLKDIKRIVLKQKQINIFNKPTKQI